MRRSRLFTSIPLTLVLLATAPVGASAEPVAEDLEDRAIHEARESAIPRGAPGEEPVLAEEVRERIFVVVTPRDGGESAVLTFDLDADGVPLYRATVESGIVQDSLFGNQDPAVTPDGRFLFVPGGTADIIVAYAIAPDGSLDEVSGSPFEAGRGSFDLAIHPSGRYLYNSEGLGRVQVFEILEGGGLALRQEVSVRASRDLEITTDGRRLYVTEGFDGLRGFSVKEDGDLEELPTSPFRSFTRNRPFEIEISANGERVYVQDLDEGVSVFRVAPDGGLVVTPESPFATNEFSSGLELTSEDRFLYVMVPNRMRIHGFAVQPDDTLAPTPGSPHPADAGSDELLHPPGSDRLYHVSGVFQRISRYAIHEDGSLAPAGTQTPIPDVREANGAALQVPAANSPPVAEAGSPETLECASPNGSLFVLDGSASSDPDSTPGTNDDIVLFEWFEGYGTAEETFLGEGEILETALALGEHVVTLRVTDRDGATDTDEVIETVIDTTPPGLAVSLDPVLLWPPDHRMVEVSAAIEAVDACGPASVRLVEVTSSEPGDATGDGNTEPDVEGATPGEPDFHFLLRAERSGSGTGREYTARYSAVDASGNEAEAEAAAIVEHDQGNRP